VLLWPPNRAVLIVSGFTQGEARPEYLDESNEFGYHCTPTFTGRYGNQAIQKLAENPQSLLDGTPDHYQYEYEQYTVNQLEL